MQPRRPTGEAVQAVLSRRRLGFSLAEICLAMLILSFALVPVFGLLTGGMMRTDVSVTYENAANIASTIMNTLLSEQVGFDELLPAGGRSSGPASQPNLLGDSGTAPDRYFQLGRIKYGTELYVGSYPATGATSLAFSYYANPQIYWEGRTDYASTFWTEVVVSADSWPDWSPYGANPVTQPTHFMDTKVGYAQNVVSIGAGDTRVSSQPIQLLKIVLFVKWGEDWSSGGYDMRGKGKRLGLVSFKARL